MPRTTDEHNKKGAAGKRITRGFEPRTDVAASAQQATVQAELANTGDGILGLHHWAQPSHLRQTLRPKFDSSRP